MVEGAAKGGFDGENRNQHITEKMKDCSPGKTNMSCYKTPLLQIFHLKQGDNLHQMVTIYQEYIPCHQNRPATSAVCVVIGVMGWKKKMV